MDPTSAIGKVIDWIVARNKSRDSKIENYLDEIRNACASLVAIEDVRSDEAKLLHEQIKSMYASVARVLSEKPGVEHETFLRVIMDGLSAARIYYWARMSEHIGEAEYRELRTGYPKSRLPSSMDALDWMLGQLDPDLHRSTAPSRDPQLLAAVRRECLHQIGHMSEAIVRR